MPGIGIVGASFALAAIIGLAVHALGFVAAKRALPRAGALLERSLLTRTKAPLRLVLPLAGMAVALTLLKVPPHVSGVLAHVFGIAIVAALSWFVIRLTYVAEDLILDRFRLDQEDNLRARQVRTQIQVFRRVTVAVVILLAFAVVLLSFRQVRAAGAGLLASAGLMGIVAGVAAKPVATNILAGLQIAISQPIRVDDVVVVQGEWGRVEEINLTYVVVRIWDLRRLVLPISWFISNTFENWTRTSSAILGYVYFDLDYTAPVELIRDRLGEVLKANPLWDGDVWNLQVTHSGASTLQMRALMGARDSASRWNLECEVRETIVTWLQQEHPTALPKVRGEIVGPAPGTPQAG